MDLSLFKYLKFYLRLFIKNIFEEYLEGFFSFSNILKLLYGLLSKKGTGAITEVMEIAFGIAALTLHWRQFSKTLDTKFC